jgi:predicted Zn-dependent peptidase
MHDPMSFSFHALPSGLRVYFQHRNLSWFGCRLVVGCGMRHSPTGKPELAHLLEHQLSTGGTRGLPRMNLTEHRRWLAERSFDCDLGRTTLDDASYGGKAPGGRADGLFRYLERYVRRPRFAGGLDHDKAIVRAEHRTRSTPADRKMEREKLKAFLGRKHPLVESFLWADNAKLAALTMSDVRAMHRGHYECPNMALIVVGGLDEDECVRLLESAFAPGRKGFVPPPPPEPLAFPEPPGPRELRARSARGRPSSVIIRYHWFLPPGRRQAAALARNALAEVLTDRVRERSRHAYTVNADDLVFLDHQRLCVTTEVAPGAVRRTRAIIDATLRDPDLIASDLPRLKADVFRALLFMELDVAETLERAATAVTLLGSPRTMAQAASAFAAVEADDVRGLIARDLAPERAYVELIEQ